MNNISLYDLMRHFSTLFLVSVFMLTAVVDTQAQLNLSIDTVDVTAFPDVRLKVRVMDGNSNVADLKVPDFTIFEDGLIVPITAGFCQDTVTQESAAVLLLIDISGSMAPWPIGSNGLTAAKSAAKAFVDRLSDKDSVALVSFSENVYYAQPWTKDRDFLKRKIDQLWAAGNTALWEAVLTSANLIRFRTQKRVIILLADGKNNVETVDAETAIAGAVSADCVVYTIGLGDRRDIDEGNLQRLADETGGSYYYAPNPSDLDEIYQRISEELKTTGVCELQYTSPIDCWNGDQVGIEVEVQTSRGFAFGQAVYTLPYDTTTFSYVNVGMEREYVVEAGEEITIPVQLNRVSAERAPSVFEFSVEFDTDLLQLVDAAAGPLAAGYTVSSTPTLQGSDLRMSGGNAIDTEGDICNLTFRAAPVYESAKTEIRISPRAVQQFCTVASSDFGLITVSGLCERALHQSADSVANIGLVSAPNPFIGSTQLRFTVTSDAHVVLRVHDLLGRPVATLVDGMRAAGTHVVNFNASGLPAGKYIVRFEGDGISEAVQVYIAR